MDMYYQVYLRNGTVYLTTMGKMDRGFYRGVEPVIALPASNGEDLRQALRVMIARGNPDVPMLRRREWPPPVTLKYAKVKTWSAFERGLLFWTIKEKDGAFQINGQKKHSDGNWRDDPEQMIILPSGTAVDDVIERMIAIVQAAARSIRT
jgi:hypothetical protein